MEPFVIICGVCTRVYVFTRMTVVFCRRMSILPPRAWSEACWFTRVRDLVADADEFASYPGHR